MASPMLLWRARGSAAAPRIALLGGCVGLGVLGVLLVWPILGGDYPPGIDTPTFLHFSWVARLAIQGQLSGPLRDPFWYGGDFPYLQAYPPLAYALVGGISALTGVALVVVFKGVLVLSYIGIAWATVWLAREVGFARWIALLAGLMVLLAYPVLAALALWGWFTTVVAMPFVLLGYGLLWRGVHRGKAGWAALGGICFGLGTLAHHMTALAVGAALVPWGLYYLGRGLYPRWNFLQICSVFISVALLTIAPWGVPFLAHALEVGFRRDIPGLWVFPLATYARLAITPFSIGGYIYPSYLGASTVFFALFGVTYALVEGRRLPGIALMALFLTWFSLGLSGNPLYRFYPFSSLDVARFPLFLAPFLVLTATTVVDAIARAVEGWRVPEPAVVWRRGVVVLVVMALVVLPLRDAWVFRGKMAPYRVDPQVKEALAWLATHSAEGDRVFGAGLWFWDTFLIPYLAHRPIVHGWHDEGAHSWRQVRSLRYATWFGQGSAEGVYATLKALGAQYVLVGEGLFSPEITPLFRQMLESRPDLFSLQVQWEKVRIFRVQ